MELMKSGRIVKKVYRSVVKEGGWTRRPRARRNDKVREFMGEGGLQCEKSVEMTQDEVKVLSSCLLRVTTIYQWAKNKEELNRQMVIH